MKGRFLLLGLATLALLSAETACAQDSTFSDVPLATTSLRAKFLAVGLDEETKQADRKLVDQLNIMISASHFGLETYSYESVVEMLTSWDQRDPLLARLTPYVYLAADALGADLVPLATYSSKATQSTTYYSWFVVRKADLPGKDEPAPADVVQFVSKGRQTGDRVRFGYHSKFSTSSYFVPALFFLSNNIFHMPAAVGRMAAIESRQIDEESSSALVRMVARGGLADAEDESSLDLAAVWDGTRKKFCEPEDEEAPRGVEVTKDGVWLCEEGGVKLFFIRLPTELPNDLLVCSASVSESTRRSITNAIKLMEDIRIGDFERWEELGQAGSARVALADLLRRAREVPATLTIDVRADPDSMPPVEAWQKAAVQEAVELSGTEFTLWEREFHKRRDFEWTLRLTHDGALELTSVPLGFERAEEAKQTHVMSFEDEVDLIDRTTSFITTRMHRIRRVWPYWSRPTVIRDLPFALPQAGTLLKISRIVWQDLEHNEYIMDARDTFESPVALSDLHKLHLQPDRFPKIAEGQIDLDPMSNVWYRVLLLREERASKTLRVLTQVFVALLVLAAVAIVVDSRRPLLKVLRGMRSSAGQGSGDQGRGG